jgi:hypothetical protein
LAQKLNEGGAHEHSERSQVYEGSRMGQNRG